MPSFQIEGGVPLKGDVQVGGSKNAALPLMAACLLTREPVRLRRVPRTSDIGNMVKVLQALGMSVEWSGAETLDLRVTDEQSYTAPRDITEAMRGSICVLGPLLARRNAAQMAQPGGCKIGERPVGAHLSGFEALGARVDETDTTITVSARRLRGAEVDMSVPSGSTVLGTANVLCAAILARGRTVIRHAAREPEIQDLAALLNHLGASVRGAGTSDIEVDGVEELHGGDFEIIPDRIEAGTLVIAAAITGGDVRIDGMCGAHLGVVFDVLTQMGVLMAEDGAGCRVRGTGRFRAADVVTRPFPGFPTDMQAQVTALMCLAEGASHVRETIFPQRFWHVAELRRMGARIEQSGAEATILGVERLHGASVCASDLRASAGLLLAALAADGRTEIRDIHHIDRGYEQIENKLRSLGARIRRVE